MRRARTRRERRAKEKQAEERKRLMAIGAIFAVVALGAGVPGVLVARELTKPDYAIDERGCSAVVETPAHVVVLLDQTDAIEPRWRAYVQQLLPALAADEALPTFARLSVLGLTDNRDAPLVEMLSECRPPDPNTGSVLFDTAAERSAREARFERFYEDRIVAVAREAEQTGPREASPILQALVALQDRLLAQPAAQTRLIIVSDMMQYTPEYPRFTHYGEYPDFDAFANSRAGADLTPFLNVHDVTVHYMRRPKLAEHQTARHQAFWTDYFLAAGVDEVQWSDDPLAALAALTAR